MTIIQINHVPPGISECVGILGSDPLRIQDRWKSQLFQQVSDAEMEQTLASIRAFIQQQGWSDLYQVKHFNTED